MLQECGPSVFTEGLSDTEDHFAGNFYLAIPLFLPIALLHFHMTCNKSLYN